MAAAPMSLEQFGQTIKAKHPEYGDLSDSDVATKVLAKYPQYKDMVQTTPTAAPDTRNDIQKSFDTNTHIDPNDTLLQKGLKSVVGTVGAPFVHPLDTITHIIPKDFATQYREAQQQPKQSLASGVVEGLGQTVGAMALGEVAAPIAGASGELIKRGAGKVALLGKTPEAAYESALKPSTTLSPAERSEAIQTSLQNGIPVSKAGFEKLTDLIDDYNQKIKGEIAADPTRPIDPNKVATRADTAKAKFANQVNAGGDLAAIDASKQQFLNEQGAIPEAGMGAPPMNAADAQTMKQGTYRVLSGKFGEQGSAAVEAQKALARGLKEEIAAQFPEIDKLNAAESKLLDLQPILERAVNRVSNRESPVGIGGPILGTGVKAATGSTGLAAVVSTMKSVLSIPEIQSRLAIAVSKGAKIPYSQAAARVKAYSIALGSAVPGSQAYSTGDNPNPPTTPQP